MVVLDRNQAAVEHPMNGAAQGDPIANRIGTPIGYGTNVRSLYLAAPAAIYDLEAGNGTGCIVGGFDRD